MLSELQKQKGIRLFHLLDDNSNGVITQEDYEEGALRLAELRNYQPESLEYQILHSKYIDFWNSLQKVADRDRDRQVTLEEWMEYFEEHLKDKEQILQVMDYIFDLLDKDCDRSITCEEYTLFLRAYRFDERSATAVFKKIDLNKDGYLSKEEFLQLANDFYFSDDPTAPGNWLFGLD